LAIAVSYIITPINPPPIILGGDFKMNIEFYFTEFYNATKQLT
jgi:hypothetical protein